MDPKERAELTAEILRASLSDELILFVCRQMGAAGLSDEALRRAVLLSRALGRELERDG